MEQKAKLRIAILSLIFVLIGNTFLFHHLEHWSYVDSFYFAGITMTTIGYGDLAPTTDITKIIVVIDALFSVGIFFYAISIITDLRVQRMAGRGIWNIPKQLNTAGKRLKRALPIEHPSKTKMGMKEIFYKKK
ncbi:MAG: potassium channel family protein [Nanoarchaeota archaeon]